MQANSTYIRLVTSVQAKRARISGGAITCGRLGPKTPSGQILYGVGIEADADISACDDTISLLLSGPLTRQ